MLTPFFPALQRIPTPNPYLLGLWRLHEKDALHRFTSHLCRYITVALSPSFTLPVAPFMLDDANPLGEGCSALLRVLRILPDMVLHANSQASSECSGWTVFSPEWGGYFSPILCHVLSPGTKHAILYLRVPQNLWINSSFRYIIGTQLFLPPPFPLSLKHSPFHPL